MSAWTIEADVFELNDINTADLKHFIVPSHETEEFLRYGRGDRKLFVVGPKGLGKTLLLRAKSQLYRDKASGFACLPRGNLCEKLTHTPTDFSRSDLSSFNNKDVWIQLWEIVLLCYLLRAFSVPLPPRFDRIVESATSLQDLLHAFLFQRSSLPSLYASIPQQLRPLVRALGTSDSVTQVAVFVDNIDEAFKDHTGHRLKKPESGTSAHGHGVWVNAQLAFVRVARDIFTSTRHIRIFGSVRSEAYEASEDSTDLQDYETYASHLQYTRAQIRQIFVNNILQTPTTQLARPAAHNHLERLIGFSKLPHRFCKNPDGTPREEDVFDYLYRHTLGRPREMMLLGGAISAAVRQDDWGPDRLRSLVHEKSADLLRQYKKEVVPYFEIEAFEFLCHSAASNVLTKKAAKRIFEEARRQLDFEHVLSYFYRLGLIGFVEGGAAGALGYTQTFRPPGRYSLLAERIPEHCDFYVIHPIVDSALQEHHGREFWDESNIVGPNYPFEPPEERVKRARHVHLGLDRDFLGLCLIELVRHRDLAVIVPPSGEWRKLQHAETLEIHHNGLDPERFAIVHDGLPEEENHARLRAWRQGHQNVVLYTERATPLEFVLRYSASLSSARGGNNLIKLLALYPEGGGPEIIYIWPRLGTHAGGVRQLEREVKQRKLETKVDSLLVDRFVYSIGPLAIEDGIAKVDVLTEAYGELVVPVAADQEPWLNGKTTQPVRSRKQREFYLLKHRHLLEGVYGFMKLSSLKRMGSETLRDQAFDIFLNIQVQRLMARVDAVAVLERSESDTRRHLYDFGRQVRARIGHLEKVYSFDTSPTSARSLRGLSVFPPRADQFYKLVRRSAGFKNSAAVLALKDLLGFNGLESCRTVFISYSYKDDAVASRIADGLKKRGVDAFLFGKDQPFDDIERIMAEQVRSRDRVVFLASSHSLKSMPCHFELSKCRERLEASWERCLICLRLDDFLLAMREEDVPRDRREVVWGNVEMLRREFSADFQGFASGGGGERFEAELDRLVRERLTLEGPTQRKDHARAERTSTRRLRLPR